MIEWAVRKGMRLVWIDEVYFVSGTYKKKSWNSAYNNHLITKE